MVIRYLSIPDLRHFSLLPQLLKWTLLLILMLGFSVNNVYADKDNEQQTSSEQKSKKLISNKKCLSCHGDDDEDEKTWEYEDGTTKFIYVDPDKFEKSVHGKSKKSCAGCHSNVKVKKGEHPERLPIKVGCISCHKEKWEKEKDDVSPEHKRLGVVVKQIDSYMHSIHARPRKDDQSRTNATCYDCHDAHNIGTVGSEQLAEHRLKNPEVCGRCHEKQKEAYLGSIHGKEVTENKNADAAVCSDCHSTHNIESPEDDQMKLAITKSCGSCHEESFKTYMSSYHGQVNRLGYTNTAKCYDCHGSHDLQKVDDPTSKVHVNNRLKTCQTCHEDAPEGFLGFHAHGNADDFEKYPFIWLTAKFMTLLIIGVFAFFWTHVILWFYREYKDRKAGKSYVPPKHLGADTVYFRRFSASWRIIHLLFAVSTMVLALTGSTLLFSHTAWAPFIIAMLGGPEIEAIIHRTAAVTWLTVFVVHFGMAIINIIKSRKTFTWFGPTSMIPNWQDWDDVKAMFRWFFGKAERPEFDRWSYWQKFDYWAPFWGAGIIGFSGMMLFAPMFTASFLPGWVFNIATIIHAEEALLATIFLFSVHFFNAHFRPDKFPMSTTIFTGVIPLDEFKHEHALEYKRLKKSGELERHLVSRPSQRMETGSKFLAAFLIVCGLALLTLVVIGYTTGGH